MTWTRILIIAAALAVAGIAPPAAEAQRPDEQARQQVRADMRAKRVQKVRHRIRAARQWKLTEALDLDEAQANRVFPILDSYDERVLTTMREGRRLRRELRRELDTGAPDDAKVNRLIDQMLAHQKAIWQLNQQRFLAVRKVLSPDQAAKALVLLPEIDRYIRREIGKAFKRRGRRGGTGGPRDPGPLDPF